MQAGTGVSDGSEDDEAFYHLELEPVRLSSRGYWLECEAPDNRVVVAEEHQHELAVPNNRKT